MNTTTIKLSIDCDYLIYLDHELNVAGYELSPDERQALSLRYNASETNETTMPLKTAYILEVFGINTTMVWLMTANGKEKKGQLLFYKPSALALSKEIVKTADEALPIADFLTGETILKKKTSHLPATIGEGSKDEVPLETILKNLPFTGWMEFYWSTSTWGQIWRLKPELQRVMASFARSKSQDELKATEDKMCETARAQLSGKGTTVTTT